jgi:phage recombination protein Bet
MTAPAPMARLPMPAEFNDAPLWSILTSIIFPAARDPKIIALAFQYCQRRGLDILKRPVNIVPVWSSELGRNVETIWPSITETEITAARSKEWAGLEAPLFGPSITQQFQGQRHDKKRGWVNSSITVSFPEWCDRTVYRIIKSERCAFTERVHWLEAYGRQGGSDLPSYMWTKRPCDQLAKVAKAAALRAAFPEESEGPTDAEVEGSMIIPGEDITPPPNQPSGSGHPGASTSGQPIGDRDDGPDRSDHSNGPRLSEPSTPSPPCAIQVEDANGWREFGHELIRHVRQAADSETARQWLELNRANLDAMAKAEPKLRETLDISIRTAAATALPVPAPPPKSEREPPDQVRDRPPSGSGEFNPDTGELHDDH